MKEDHPCYACGTQRCPGAEVDPCKKYLDWVQGKQSRDVRKVRISELGLPRVKGTSPMPPVKPPKVEAGTFIGRKIKSIVWTQDQNSRWHHYNGNEPTVLSMCGEFLEIKFSDGVEWINQADISRFILA
jgi:hypothetical protein